MLSGDDAAPCASAMPHALRQGVAEPAPLASLRSPLRSIGVNSELIVPVGRGTNKGRRPKPTPLALLPGLMPYMLPFEQVFVVASHFMWSFSQADLVVGILSAAKTGAANPAARPKAMVTARSLLIDISSWLAKAACGS